jgi:hypothetical protein
MTGLVVTNSLSQSLVDDLFGLKLTISGTNLAAGFWLI